MDHVVELLRGIESIYPWGYMLSHVDVDPEESPVCTRVTCRRCGKATWSGCGQHVNQVLKGVPKSQRCTCPPAPSLVERLFGGRKKTTA